MDEIEEPIRVKRRRMFGERVTKMMLMHQLTAVDIVAHCPDLSFSHVYHWKKGFCFPRVDSLISLAEVLHCSIDYLVGKADL